MEWEGTSTTCCTVLSPNPLVCCSNQAKASVMDHGQRHQRCPLSVFKCRPRLVISYVWNLGGPNWSAYLNSRLQIFKWGHPGGHGLLSERYVPPPPTAVPWSILPQLRLQKNPHKHLTSYPAKSASPGQPHVLSLSASSRRAPHNCISMKKHALSCSSLWPKWLGRGHELHQVSPHYAAKGVECEWPRNAQLSAWRLLSQRISSALCIFGSR